MKFFIWLNWLFDLGGQYEYEGTLPGQGEVTPPSRGNEGPP